MLRAILVEDSEDDALLLVRELTHHAYEVRHLRVETRDALEQALRTGEWDLVLCDFTMPRFRGTDALRVVKELGIDVPVIFVSGTIGEDVAVEAMKAGAHDYVMKGNLKRLIPAIDRELREAEVRRNKLQAERELKESEQRLRYVIDHDANGIVVVDQDGGTIFANKAAGILVGKSPAELVGRQFGIPIAGDNEPPVEVSVVGKERMAIAEMAVTSIVWCKKPAFLVSLHDVTKRKEAENALKESEFWLRESQRVSQLGSYVYDIEQDQWTGSAALDGIFGIGPEYQRTVKGWLDLVHPDDRSMMDEHLADVLNKTHKFDKDYRLAGGLGQERWVHGLGEVVCDEEGRPVKIIGTIQDITERKRAEKALQNSEEKFRALFEFAPDAYYLMDRHGTFLAGNAGAETLTGYNRSELVGKNFMTAGLLIDEDLKQASESFHTLLSGKDVGQTEYTLRRKSGEPVVIDLRTHVMKIAGQDLVLGIARDITEQKRAEEALRNSEALLRESQAIGKIGSWEYNFESHTIVWSAETYRLYERDPAIGPPTPEEEARYYSPDDAKRLQEYAEEVVRTKAGRSYDVTVNLPSGRIAWFHGVMHSHVNKSGTIDKIAGTIQDITERRKGEEIVRQNEERLRAFFDATSDGVIVEHDDHVVFANRAAAGIYGYESPGDLIGKPTEEIQWGDEIERAAVFSRMRVRGEQVPPRYELRGMKKDGSPIDLELSVSMFRIDEEPYIISIVRDIRDRKMAELKIREQAELLDNASDGIVVRDLSDHVLFWNKGAERMYGWRREEVIGRSASEFLYSDKGNVFSKITRDIHEKGQWEGELEHKTKDGKTIIVRSHWTLMRDPEGNAQSILAVNTDITERKALETQFLRAQRMESIGTLAGGIAHDLNNVLAPILLSFEVLGRTVKDEKAQRLLESAQASAIRGKGIISQVLSFARGMEGQRGPVQIKHVLKEVIDIAKETFPRSIEVRSSVDKDLALISGDVTQLHQVFLNLCVNARDAMPNGGRLDLRAENYEVDEQFARFHLDAHAGPYILVTVSDTGTGIPPGIVERIFEPFFTTKAQGKGTGLGLSTVHTIVKGHGGFIDLDTEVGRGTTFMVYFPVVSSKTERNGDKPHPDTAKGRGERILVVDDEAPIREIISQSLEDHGYRVLTAKDGIEAITLVAEMKGGIDLLLTDIMMPQMDGIALARAVRKLLPELPIVVSSGLIARNAVEDLGNVNIQAILSKPYATEPLLATIRSVLSGAYRDGTTALNHSGAKEKRSN